MHWNTLLKLSTLTHTLLLWVLWRFPLCLRRISTFSHPPQIWNLYLPTWNFFNAHPKSNSHFSLGTSTPSSNSCCGVKIPVNCFTLQVYVFLLSLSILTFQFQHFICPKITNTKRNYYQRITNYRVSNFDQTYQLEMLKTVTKTTRVEISTPS